MPRWPALRSRRCRWAFARIGQLAKSWHQHGAHLAGNRHGPICVLRGQLSVIINLKHNQIRRITYKRSVHLHGQLDTQESVSDHADPFSAEALAETDHAKPTVFVA